MCVTQSKDQELRAKGLTTFCRHALAQQASLLLPLVRQSYLECRDLEDWRRLDGLCQVGPPFLTQCWCS